MKMFTEAALRQHDEMVYKKAYCDAAKEFEKAKAVLTADERKKIREAAIDDAACKIMVEACKRIQGSGGREAMEYSADLVRSLKWRKK